VRIEPTEEFRVPAPASCVSHRDHRSWTLDTDRLLAALTAGTRAVMINSPNNPTGWTIDRDSQHAILAHCRRHGIWIVADDVYERLHYAAPGCAPSFLDITTAQDRLVSTNSFSKSWLMTGWRLGWIVAPEPLMEDLGKLIEYNTSCSPVFVQRAGVVALRDGEPTSRIPSRATPGRVTHLVGALAALPGVEAAASDGGNVRLLPCRRRRRQPEFCKRLVRDARLGLAPGSAFGPEGEGFVRWCFAASEERLTEGVRRLRSFLERGR
jgi:aspartate/methionine/tyrosine aminotransferase